MKKSRKNLENVECRIKNVECIDAQLCVYTEKRLKFLNIIEYLFCNFGSLTKNINQKVAFVS